MLQIQHLVSLILVSEVIRHRAIITCLESNSVNHASVTTLTSDNGVNTTLTISNHICTREETYIEQTQTPTMQQVKVRASNWCLDIPPRCSNYKTEFREVIKLENITKTRTIRYCCDGFAGITSTNETICKPICRGGCGRGYCHSPNECQCDAGYMGKHCTQRCSHDRWGEACRNVCRCRNQSVCDNRSGICHCTSGWTGVWCELPCPQGLHGVMCKKTCNCSSNRCNPQTGDCLVDENILPVNVTSSMIESLNSTIVNITQNLNRLAKNLGTTETVTYLVPDTILDATTLKTIQEVILIKPPDQPTPSIIVHQPGGGSKTPEVIHVITNWQQEQLTGSGDSNETRVFEAGLPTTLDSESKILTVLLVVLLCIMVFLALGFLIIYKKFNFKRDVMANPATLDLDGSVGVDPNSKVFTKPLPDLPAFTQIIRNKVVDGPEFYDCPTNNSAVKPPYCYARKESLYSVIPKSRKGSVESHLYDEIRYPGAHKISHM